MLESYFLSGLLRRRQSKISYLVHYWGVVHRAGGFHSCVLLCTAGLDVSLMFPYFLSPGWWVGMLTGSQIGEFRLVATVCTHSTTNFPSNTFFCVILSPLSGTIFGIWDDFLCHLFAVACLLATHFLFCSREGRCSPIVFTKVDNALSNHVAYSIRKLLWNLVWFDMSMAENAVPPKGASPGHWISRNCASSLWSHVLWYCQQIFVTLVRCGQDLIDVNSIVLHRQVWVHEGFNPGVTLVHRLWLLLAACLASSRCQETPGRAWLCRPWCRWRDAWRFPGGDLVALLGIRVPCGWVH